MSKEKFVDIVINSFNDDNRMMAAGQGMSPEQVEENIEKSQQALQFMINNAYDKLKQQNLVI